jgi:hypothetical protein
MLFQATLTRPCAAVLARQYAPVQAVTFGARVGTRAAFCVTDTSNIGCRGHERASQHDGGLITKGKPFVRSDAVSDGGIANGRMSDSGQSQLWLTVSDVSTR